ncbi:DivIVA domain-containing protein, partial [Dietzia aerolata]
MPLTPADVHNVAFSKPPIGKRGYNEDEVDQFLDLVEKELAELVADNEDLRHRVDELSKDLEKARKSGDKADKSDKGSSESAPSAPQAAAPAAAAAAPAAA